MSALIIAILIDFVPPSAAAAPDGIIVFPVPDVLGWLIVSGLLAIACAILGMVSARRTQRIGRTGGGGPLVQPQPHQL